MPREHDDAGHVRGFREQPRCRFEKVCRRLLLDNFCLKLPDEGFFQRANGQKGVDEKPITGRGRHPSGTGVRGRDESQILKVGHDVPDGGRAQVQPCLLRQSPRSDRLPVIDITLHKHLQEVLGSIVEGRLDRHGGRS